MAAQLIVVVYLHCEFQAWARLKKISKAAHLLVLKWPIQHFHALFQLNFNLVEGIICKMTCYLFTFPQLR